MRILLTGFMGAGKSAVGRVLAQRLGVPFVDLDEVVEQQAGRSVRQIFDTLGEAEFRRLERAALQQAVEGADAVIATGGGTLADREAIGRVAKHAVSVWLDPGLEVIEQRLDAAGRESRPLHGNPSRVRELYRQRLPWYRLADLRVQVDAADSVDEVADRVATMLKESGCDSW